jgi:hypothetical protein
MAGHAMQKVLKFVYVALFLIASVNGSCASAASQTDWTNVRVIVYENRKAGKLLGCAEQHIREHIYARNIHKSLDAEGKWPFVVSAQSSIDKIVVAVDILAKKTDRNLIATAIERGLSDKPRFESIESEAWLVTVEEEAASARPQLADRLLWQLSSAPVALKNCRVKTPSEANLSNRDWKVGYHQIVFFDRQQIPDNNFSGGNSQGEAIESRGIFDTTVKGSVSRDDDPSKLTGDALFVGLIEPHNAERHIMAAAQIFLAMRDLAAPPPEVHPFGIGGFILFGKPEVLAKVSARMAMTVPEDLDSPANDAMLTSEISKARNYVCAVPYDQHPSIGSWADAVAFHPYFYFWTHEPACSRTNLNNWKLRPSTKIRSVQLYHQLVSSGSINGEPIKVKSLKYSFCYNYKNQNQEFNSVSRDTLFQAMRQYFRFDIGFVLDIKEKKLSQYCSKIGLIVPLQYHSKIEQEIARFNSKSKILRRRLRSAKIHKDCKEIYSNQCKLEDALGNSLVIGKISLEKI